MSTFAPIYYRPFPLSEHVAFVSKGGLIILLSISIWSIPISKVDNIKIVLCFAGIKYCFQFTFM